MQQVYPMLGRVAPMGLSIDRSAPEKTKLPRLKAGNAVRA